MKKRESLVENWHDLPKELLTDVFAKFPVKTLLILRCVCKSWCNLIDSDDFISLHREICYNNSSNEQLLILSQHQGKCYTFTIRRIDETFNQIVDVVASFPTPLYILESVYGLCLFKNNLLDHQEKVKLWNPSIRKCLIVPDCPITSSYTDIIKALHFRYKLGFAPSSNDYKVVAIDCEKQRLAVYSLNDHCWRVKTNYTHFESCVISRLRPYAHESVFSNGAMYWVGGRRYKEQVVYSFDFDVEEFGTVKLPDGVKECSIWFIFCHGESIGAFTISTEKCCIWVMEKVAEDYTWSLKWLLENPNLDAYELLKTITGPYPYPHSLPKMTMLYIPKSNSFFMVQKGYRMPYNKLFLYNLSSQELQDLGECKFSTDYYMENLVLHKGIEGQTLVPL